MPYTGTTPYTAQEFVPGQKALAQDVTNMSYVLARLDQNASSAYCVRSKPLNTDNQSGSSASGTISVVTTKTVVADPLGSMATQHGTTSDITIPFDGIWTVSVFLNGGSGNGTSAGSADNVAGWFRLNGVAGNDNLLAVTVMPSTNVTTSITLPLSAGDYLTPYYYWRTNTNALVLQRAYFSVSLVH